MALATCMHKRLGDGRQWDERQSLDDNRTIHECVPTPEPRRVRECQPHRAFFGSTRATHNTVYTDLDAELELLEEGEPRMPLVARSKHGPQVTILRATAWLRAAPIARVKVKFRFTPFAAYES